MLFRMAGIKYYQHWSRGAGELPYVGHYARIGRIALEQRNPGTEQMPIDGFAVGRGDLTIDADHAPLPECLAERCMKQQGAAAEHASLHDHGGAKLVNHLLKAQQILRQLQNWKPEPTEVVIILQAPTDAHPLARQSFERGLGKKANAGFRAAGSLRKSARCRVDNNLHSPTFYLCKARSLLHMPRGTNMTPGVNLIKTACTLLFVSVCASQIAAAQTNPRAPSPARTDVYHVLFAKAALGKAAEEAAMKGHYLVLRHQEGEDWDYVVIEHLGTKATVEPNAPPPPQAARDLGAYHNDTFVSGPSWADFARSTGVDQAARTAGSVYVVSVYRAAPAHRDPLEKLLLAPPDKGDTSAGNVVLQHLEGGPWQYLSIARYNSWQEFATNEANSRTQTMKGSGPWFQLRDHAVFHNDTLADRIAP